MSATVLRTRTEFKTKLLAKTAAFTFPVPAGYYIKDIFVENTTANAVTGGIKVGTTDGGVDVVAALAVGANALTYVLDAALLKRIFSLTAATTLYFDAVTAFNSASLNVTIILGKV